jgi:hypothetical protein
MARIFEFSRLIAERELLVANRQLSQVSQSRREHEEKATFHIEQATRLERDEATLTAQVKRLEAMLFDAGTSEEAR